VVANLGLSLKSSVLSTLVIWGDKLDFLSSPHMDLTLVVVRTMHARRVSLEIGHFDLAFVLFDTFVTVLSLRNNQITYSVISFLFVK